MLGACVRRTRGVSPQQPPSRFLQKWILHEQVYKQISSYLHRWVSKFSSTTLEQWVHNVMDGKFPKDTCVNFCANDCLLGCTTEISRAASKLFSRLLQKGNLCEMLFTTIYVYLREPHFLKEDSGKS